MIHGTINGYRLHGCRCDECREARKSYVDRNWYDACECGKPKRRISAQCADCYRDRTRPKHGTLGRYRHHRCRCELCCEAASEARGLSRSRCGRVNRDLILAEPNAMKRWWLSRFTLDEIHQMARGL